MDLLDQPLGQLARNIAGATQVFHAYQLDFCCGGKHSLRAAMQGKEAEIGSVLAQLQKLQAQNNPSEADWNNASPELLIAHILERFHAVHRAQLPELIRLAARVEEVHGEREGCPLGLARHLQAMQQDLESHMQKEELILFPMLLRGLGMGAQAPMQVMRMEHDQHGEALEQLAVLTNHITLPPAACNTWRALYLGLRTLREDLMQHIHLENNILFEQAEARSDALRV